jgi:hypothetical protein
LGVSSLISPRLPELYPDPNNSLELDSKLQFICHPNREVSFLSLNDVAILEIMSP